MLLLLLRATPYNVLIICTVHKHTYIQTHTVEICNGTEGKKRSIKHPAIDEQRQRQQQTATATATASIYEEKKRKHHHHQSCWTECFTLYGIVNEKKGAAHTHKRRTRGAMLFLSFYV